MKLRNIIKINLIMILVIVLCSINSYSKNIIGNSTDATMRDDYFTSTSKQGFSRGESSTYTRVPLHFESICSTI